MSSNFAIPTDLRVGEYLTVILGCGFSTLAVALRVYTKLRFSKSMLWEDCMFMRPAPPRGFHPGQLTDEY